MVVPPQRARQMVGWWSALSVIHYQYMKRESFHDVQAKPKKNTVTVLYSMSCNLVCLAAERPPACSPGDKGASSFKQHGNEGTYLRSRWSCRCCCCRCCALLLCRSFCSSHFIRLLGLCFQSLVTLPPIHGLLKNYRLILGIFYDL